MTHPNLGSQNVTQLRQHLNYSWHDILCTILCAYNSMHSDLCILFYAQYSQQCIIYKIIIYAQLYLHCMLSKDFYTQYSMQSMLCKVFYAKYSMHSILCIVLYAQYLAQLSVQLIAPSEFRQQFWTRVLDQTIRLLKNMLKHFPKCNIGL